MHRPAGAVDLAAIGGADALVAEADAEDRDGRPEALDDARRDAGLGGAAGAGREDDVAGRQDRDVGQAHGVVAQHQPLPAQLGDVAGEVPDEAVIVVDQQDHGARQRLDQGPRLVQRLLVFGRRLAVGDDAAAGLEGDGAALDGEGADGDGAVHRSRRSPSQTSAPQ